MSSPEGSPAGSPEVAPAKCPKWEVGETKPVVPEMDVSYLYPFQAGQWGQLGWDLAIRLERVALSLRVRQEGWRGEEGAVMDARELNSAWDKMVHSVQADEDLWCLFDTGRASSTE